MTMPSQDNSSDNSVHNLLIEFAYKRTQGSFKKISTPYPIQGLHYEYGFKITNIGDGNFPGGKLSNVNIKFISTNTALQSPNVHLIPPIDAMKSVIIYTNNIIFDYPGAMWVSCNISPDKGQVKTFQCSKGQKNYVSVNPINDWSNAAYVVPHMEYLQSLTNRYVLLLTIVTLVLGVASLFFGAERSETTYKVPRAYKQDASQMRFDLISTPAAGNRRQDQPPAAPP